MSAVAPASQEMVMRPPGRWEGLRLAELWAYRELLYFLTKRELLIRYKQSLFGVSWAIVQPLSLTVIFAVFFGRLAGVPSDGVPYPIFALAGLVPWTFVSSATAQAATSLVADANLISKVYFPRVVIPVAKVLSLLPDLALALVVLVAAAAFYGIELEPRAVLMLPFLLLGVATATGFGVLLAALNVKYRDVSVVVPVGVQIWLFATPVAYPSSLVDGALADVWALNPLVSVIGGVRWALLATPLPSGSQCAVSTVVAIVAVVLSVLYLRRTERFFADVV